MAESRTMNSHSPFNASSGISCSSSPAYLWGDTGGYLSDMKIHPRRVPFLAGMVDHEPLLLSVPATSYIGYLGGSSGNLTVLLGEAQSRHKKAKVKRVLGSSNNLTTSIKVGANSAILSPSVFRTFLSYRSTNLVKEKGCKVMLTMLPSLRDAETFRGTIFVGLSLVFRSCQFSLTRATASTSLALKPFKRTVRSIGPLVAQR